MILRDLTDPDLKHEGLFMFQEDEHIYLVNEHAYDRFVSETDRYKRHLLADLIINVKTNSIVKSRYF